MIAPLMVDPADRPKPESANPPPGFWIAGQHVRPSSDETFESIDPTTGQSLTRLAVAVDADIDAAVGAAAKAFASPEWSGLDPSRRERLLLQVAEVIEANAEELATLDSLEMGGTLPLTRWMVDHTVKVFRHFAGWPSKIYGQTAPAVSDQLQYTLRQPLGVIAGIAGWNGPVLQMGYKIAPALATGNTIVVKPSEQSSLSMLRLAELLAATDLQPGVFNVVTGPGRTTGDSLMTHAGVSKVSFTGSTAVGRHILESSSSDFRHVTLELGGKSPIVVFADADLEAAATTCATAFCANSGQACVAGTRIYVEQTARERFTELLVAAVDDYARGLGDPFHPGTRMGPIALRGHYDEVRDFVQTARRDGRLITGAEPVEGPGLFVPPTLVTDIDENSPVVQQEIFGPVAALGSFRTFDEAITLANDTIYASPRRSGSATPARPCTPPQHSPQARSGSTAAASKATARCRSAAGNSPDSAASTAPRSLTPTPRSRASSSNSEPWSANHWAVLHWSNAGRQRDAAAGQALPYQSRAPAARGTRAP